MLTITPIESRLVQRDDGTRVMLRAQTRGDRGSLDTFIGELTESSRRSRLTNRMPAGGRGRRVALHAHDVRGFKPVAASHVAR